MIVPSPQHKEGSTRNGWTVDRFSRFEDIDQMAG